jgi:dTDP-4-dehydrorhamnose reductase
MQKENAIINGFTNHNWNGITTKVFGMIAVGIVKNNSDPVGKLHLLPKDKVSKFELVNIIKAALGRQDITVNEFQAEFVIDRTLSTEHKDHINQIWKNAGFNQAPKISEMVNLGL